MTGHPGRTLAEELVARGWSQADLAFVLGCSPNVVSLIVNGRRGVSPAMSAALGQALGLPPDHFRKLQSTYAMAKAGVPDAGISARAVQAAARPETELQRERNRRFYSMTKIDLDAIVSRAREAKERADKATPLPWLEGQRKLRNKPPVNDHPGCSSVAMTAPGQGVFTAHAGGIYPANDAKFIAAARADVPTLADDVLALVECVRELEKEIEASDLQRIADDERVALCRGRRRQFRG